MGTVATGSYKITAPDTGTAVALVGGMAGILWRVLIAVVAVVLTFALIPPMSRVLGFAVQGDVFTIVKICVAGLAVLYILRGPTPTWRS